MTYVLLSCYLPLFLATSGGLFCTPLRRCGSVCLMNLDLRIRNVVLVLIIKRLTLR